MFRGRNDRRKEKDQLVKGKESGKRSQKSDVDKGIALVKPRKASLYETFDARQLKPFTRWWDFHCAPKGLHVTNVVEQIPQGVAPFALLEAMEGRDFSSLRRKHPKSPAECRKNLDNFVALLHARSIPFDDEQLENLAKGEVTEIITLTWELILRYDVCMNRFRRSNPTADGPIAVTNLLSWSRTMCGQPKYGIELKIPREEWAQCFRDGRAFCALVNAYRAPFLSFHMAEKLEPRERLRMVFEKALQLGVPRLLDVDDVLAGNVDAKCMIVYVAKLRLGLNLIGYIVQIQAKFRSRKSRRMHGGVWPEHMLRNRGSPADPAPLKSKSENETKKSLWSSSELISTTTPERSGGSVIDTDDPLLIDIDDVDNTDVIIDVDDPGILMGVAGAAAEEPFEFSIQREVLETSEVSRASVHLAV
jgi:hypothetical protein